MNSLARKYKLTLKQFEFLKLWLAEKRDAGGCYMRVYSVKSKKIADSKASQMLSKPKIQAYISEIEKAAERRLISKVVATKERIIDEESCIAFFDPAELFDADGRLLSIHKMPEHVRRGIAAFKIKSKEFGGGEELTWFDILSEFKLQDKGRALDRLEKVFGMQREKIDLGGEGLKEILKEIDGFTRGVLPGERDE